MNPDERAALSPEMLLFEVAAMCSRHGIAVPATVNPGAARHYASQLLRALGLVSDAPAGALPAALPPARWSDATTALPLIREPAPGSAPIDPRPLRERIMPARGAHRVSRPLSAVRDDG